MEIKMINLTPHIIRFLDPASTRFSNVEPVILRVIQPSGLIARANYKERRLEVIHTDLGITLNVIKTDFGKVINLPPKREGVILLVSRLVVELEGHRRPDIYFIAGLRRDPRTGKVMGGTGLARI